MIRFKVLEDINIMGTILAKKDEIINIVNDKYEFKTDEIAINLNIDQLRKDNRFLELEDLKLNFEEIEDDWDLVKTWRLQLDIRTSKKNLPVIQSLIEDLIAKYI